MTVRKRQWTCKRQDRILRATEKLKRVFAEIDGWWETPRPPELQEIQDVIDKILSLMIAAAGRERG